MGFLSEYERSKGPPETEELSDRVQRPLGFVVAKALFPTRVSPDTVTAMAMICAAAGGVSLILGRNVLAAALVLMCAVLDSTDGQLARMRGTASLSGRMIDGTADMIGAVFIVIGSTWSLLNRYGTSTGRTWAILVACLVAAFTSSVQFSLFDHYKNVWVRMVRGSAAPDEYEDARHRRAQRTTASAIEDFVWRIYLFYLRSQHESVARFDPFTRVRAFPTFSEECAARYRRENAGALRVWSLFFGFGTMLIGASIAAAFDVLLAFLVFRLVALNAVFYLWLRPAQRRASRTAFAGVEERAALPEVARDERVTGSA